MLIETVSKGGNLLLNVGPTARGEFDERAMERLSGIGKWLRNHGRSIYGCTEAPAAFKAPPDCRLTYNPETQRLYAHLFAWPFMELHLDGFAGKVKYAQFLHDGSEVRLAEREAYQAAVDSISTNTLTLRLPVQKPNTTVPVIELFLNKR
jgi:alpha-L-fucosidase